MTRIRAGEASDSSREIDGRLSERRVPPGAIGWNEYATTDVERARAFFTGLFGWSTRAKEFAHEGVYITFTMGGHDVAGLLSVNDLAVGDAAGWFPVIRVSNVDAIVAKASEIGATILAEPTGLAGLGRHAMLAGPSRGRMSLLDLPDDRAVRGIGCVGWNEFHARDPAATALFLWQTFGWNAEALALSDEGLVTVFTFGGHRIASMRKTAPNEPSQCLPCIEVGDVTATIRRARELGGALREERQKDQVLGHAARLVDPLGIEFVVCGQRAV